MLIGLGDTTTDVMPVQSMMTFQQGCALSGKTYNPAMDKLAQALGLAVQIPAIPFSPLLKNTGFGGVVIVPALSAAIWGAIGYYGFGGVRWGLGLPAAIIGGWFLAGHFANQECSPEFGK